MVQLYIYSVIYMCVFVCVCIYILFHILVPLWFPTGYSFLCYTVGPCLFFIQHCIFVSLKLLIYSPSRFPFGNHGSVFYVWESVSVLTISSFVSFFRFHICDIILYLCLSDLVLLVWSSLGPSVLLQIALFHCLLWLSNIPLYVCTIFSRSIHLLVDTQVASMSWLL